MVAAVVCNGTVRDYSYYRQYFQQVEYIISVDGGASHVRRFGVMPSLLLGDFDSIDSEDFNFFKAQGVEIMNFPPEKDMTDTELAVELAVQKGYKKIIIIGGAGSRLDHSLANIFILKKLHDMGAEGIIVDEYNEITVIDDKIQIKREEGIKVTLLPLSQRVEGVTTKGLYYPLDNATIEMGSTWGVSNEFDSDMAEVTVKAGLLLVIKSRD